MKFDHLHKHRGKIRISMIITTIMFLLIGFGFGAEYLRNREIEGEIARMEKENGALESERLASLKLIDTLSSSYYVEGEARQSGMGKEGEQLVIIGKQQGTVAPAQSVNNHDDVPNPLRWWWYFFDRAQFSSLENI